MNVLIHVRQNKRVTSCDTTLTSCVGHAMNLSMACLTYCISDVGYDFNASMDYFFSIDLYHIICISHTVYGGTPMQYFSQCTNCVPSWRCTYNPILGMTLATSSPKECTPVSALLPFGLTWTPNCCMSALIGGEHRDPFYDNSILMACFNAIVIFSKLFLLSSSIWLLISFIS